MTNEHKKDYFRYFVVPRVLGVLGSFIFLLKQT